MSEGVSREEGARLWRRVLERVRMEEGEGIYRNWFASVAFDRLEGDRAYIRAETRFIAKWLRENYERKLLRFWRDESPHLRRVVILEAQAGSARVRGTPRPEKAAPMGDIAPRDQALEITLKEEMHFSSFITGASNHLAYQAALDMAGLPKKTGAGSSSFNSFFIHGASGLGKTHLMNAIALALRKQGVRLLYVSAHRFRHHFVKLIRERKGLDFKASFEDLQAFLIDDLHQLKGEKTQEEFTEILKGLMERHARLILSATEPPSDLAHCSKQMRSLLGSGFVAEIRPADYALRLRILREKARVAAGGGAHVPREILEFLARRFPSNIRELEGALRRVLAYSSYYPKKPISMDMAKDSLQDLLRVREPVLTVEKIQRKVAEHYGVTQEEILGASRRAPIVRPRQVAVYLAKKLTRRSLPDLGRRFGGRDHTTIMHSVSRIEDLIEKDPEIRAAIDVLTRDLLA